MKKKDANTVKALLERAYSVLDESAEPYVVFFPTLNFVRVSEGMANFVIIVEGSNTIYSNTEKRHAEAMIEDMSDTLITCRQKMLEKGIEDALDKDGWQDGDEPKA